jgi:hypothetical protein
MGLFKRTLFIVIVLLMATMTSSAQQQEIVGLPDPAPAWPANGIVPAELKEKYVFVDTAKNEFVIAYPENLGTPAFEKDGPGALKIARYELLRNVSPSVTLAVTPATAGKFKYAYTVGNGAAAKQSIDQFSIVAPEQVGDAIKGPAGWFSIVQRGRDFKVKDPQWIKTGAAVVWSFQKPEEVIQPGSKKTGFEMESELKPGFTVGYFRKAESVEVKVATSGNIPEPVKKQKDELLSVEYNSKTVLLLGPKFARDADEKAIAADFAQGLNALGRSGALSPDSEFVKGAVAELNRVSTAGGPAKITAQPRSEIETEILNAIKVSLRTN